MSRYDLDLYSLTAYLTKGETQHQNRAALHEKRLLEVDRAILRLSSASDVLYRERVMSCVNIFFFEMQKLMFKRFHSGHDTDHSDRYAFSQSYTERLKDIYEELRDLVCEGELIADDSQLKAMRALKARLEDNAFQGLMAKVTQ